MTTTRELFGKHSLRCTQQRMAVYESLAACDRHPTAEEIFCLVRPRTSRVSLATVYNALEALSNAGLVRRIATTNGTSRYDADTATHAHVCLRDSSEIRNVPFSLGNRLLAALPPHVLEEIAAAMDVEIREVSVRLLARRLSRPEGHGMDPVAAAQRPQDRYSNAR